MKTKYVIECTEDNVTCTLRQHFEKYYPELDHDLVKFPIIDLYYGIIDGKIRAVPSYHKSYACLSVDEANAFMSSEALNQEIDGNISLVPDSDQKLRLIALEHAVKIGCESGSKIEQIIKSAEKCLSFLKGEKAIEFEYVVKSECNVPILPSDVTHFKP